MKRDDFEKIGRQLEPEDKLIQSVMDRAEQLAADPKKKNYFLAQNDTVKIRSSNKYAVIISPAAALLLVFGATVYFRSSNGSIKTDKGVSLRTEKDTLLSSEQNSSHDSIIPDQVGSTVSVSETDTTSAGMSYAPEKNESKNDKKEEISRTDDSATDSKSEIVDDGRAEWFPDPAADEYSLSIDGGQAAAYALPVDEYLSFELDGVAYRFACGNYGEIYENYIGGKNIPNSSYIGEQIALIDIPSMLGDIHPNTTAEVYSLKYADSNYLIAVKFPYFNNDPRYYLFANTEKTYDTFAEHMYSLNIDKYTFDGQAINEYNGSMKYIDDDSELTQMFLSAEGELTDAANGEALWKTYLDIPIYGACVSFTCYSEGQIAVNAFGREFIYNVGTYTTSQITSYINENAHE